MNRTIIELITPVFFCGVMCSCVAVGQGKGEDHREKINRFSGTFFPGEYSHFQNVDGQEYVLYIPEKRQQKEFAKFTSPSFEKSGLCASIRILGYIAGRADDPGRMTLNIVRIQSAKEIRCPKG